MNTTADAQGNASASLYYLQSGPPDQTEFSTVMTPQMELLHFINNEDVMEHAGEMDELLAQNTSAAHRLTTMNSGQLRRRGGGLRAAIQRNNDRIEELEGLILVEIAEAQSEYRMLAEILDGRRGQYMQARAEIGDAPITRGQQLRISRTGRTSDRPELNRQNMHPVLEFERYYDAYRLLEAGFAYVTTEEQLGRLFRAIGREILIEVITLGLAKYVRVVRAGLTALDRAAAAIAESVGEVVVSRYRRLSPATRERLGNLHNRREPDRPSDHPVDGDTTRGTPASSQLDETCNIGGAACSLG